MAFRRDGKMKMTALKHNGIQFEWLSQLIIFSSLDLSNNVKLNLSLSLFLWTSLIMIWKD